MHRLIVLLSVCVLAATLLPAAASAATWVVKSQSGTKMGTVRTTSATKASVYNRTGTKQGAVDWFSKGPVYTAYMAFLSDKGAQVSRRYFSAGGTGVWMWLIQSIGTASWAAGKHQGRWVVYGYNAPQGAHYGNVSAGCPGWAAAGAVYILNKRME